MSNMEDRMSLLPDSLLDHILSFLNTKQVVQTCVLAKRWKTLWTHIPTLIFDYNSYASSELDDFNQRSFRYFIIRVLSQHSGTTRIKKLSYSSSNNEAEVFLAELLICYAGCHNVQELYINTYSIGYYDWKYNFSTCSSLTVLKMVCGFVDDWEDLSLPSLRILEIECDWEERDEKANYNRITLFSGCPNLESLVFVNYLFESATMCAPKLENLELCASFYFDLTFPEIQLLTPNLKGVKFSNILPTVLSDSKFPCIHEVNIQLEDREFAKDDKDRNKLTSNFNELLRVFENASSFTLPLKATQAIMSLPFESKGLSFCNMRHLRLKTDETDRLFAYLLERPSLKTFAVLNERNKDRTVSD